MAAGASTVPYRGPRVALETRTRHGLRIRIITRTPHADVPAVAIEVAGGGGSPRWLPLSRALPALQLDVAEQLALELVTRGAP